MSSRDLSGTRRRAREGLTVHGRRVTRGMRFVHARQLIETPGVPVRDWPRATCEITKVTASSVYFRNHTGFPSVLPIAAFPDAVREWVDE